MHSVLRSECTVPGEPEGGDTTRRCLILANQTLCGAHLLETVQQRVGSGEHEFYVVVPATPVTDQALRSRRLSTTA